MKCNRLALILAAALLAGCGAKETEQKAETVRVKEMTVGAQSGTGEYNYSGTVEEENGSSLSFTMGGTVTQIRVRVGDRVSKGQLIATVDPATVRNSYDMARTTLTQAEDAYKRMKQLHDSGSLPEMKWVEVQSQLEQAVSAEKIARKNLDDCTLCAPYSGVVSAKYVDVGQNAAPGMPVVKLATTSVLNVMVSVPEGEMQRMAAGQRASVSVPALDNRVYTGRVIEKGVVADPVSRSYSVKIRLDNADSRLLPGMVAKVATGVRSAEGIVIPARLLQLADDNTFFVWTDEGGKAARRAVTCGGYTADGVVIMSGLAYGDRLITEGQQKVCDGIRLTLGGMKNEE